MLLSRVRLSCLVGLLLLASVAEGQAFHTETIQDPVLGMKAYDYFIPNGWKSQGTFMQGSSCVSLPSPVWRAYSPDGLSEYRVMPRFDWSWTNAPYGAKQQADCLPLKKNMTARQFLAYLEDILKINYVGDMDESAFAQKWMGSIATDNAALHSKVQISFDPFRGDTAAGRYKDRNGTFTIEEQVRVAVRCSHQDVPGFGGRAQFYSESCGAEVRVLRAPEGKLDALVALIDARGGIKEDDRWTQARIARIQNQMRQNAQDSQRIIAAREQQFQRDQATRAQQNEQYQAATQSRYAQQNANAAATRAGYAQHNANEAANMNARHTPASDWVDYALDQQTVAGPNGTMKVSGAYNQTWTSSTGSYYQTNNPNANPNGVLSGTWTQTTQVHGNGQPY